MFSSDHCRVRAHRLLPSQDLRGEIENLVRSQGIRAGFVLSAVGSLTQVTLRLANQQEARRWNGHFEIVSLCGTLGPDGPHLHMAVSDEQGQTVGGHVLEGCLVYTTVELVLGEATGFIFRRELDPSTTFQELSIQPAP